MNKWFLILIILINILVSLYAIAPQFVTFAETYPEHISYVVNNDYSIRQAIIQIKIESLYIGRDIYGRGAFYQSILMLFNVTIILNSFFKSKNNKKKFTTIENIEEKIIELLNILQGINCFDKNEYKIKELNLYEFAEKVKETELEYICFNLYHYVDDIDIRLKDEKYKEFQDIELEKLIKLLKKGDIKNAKEISFLHVSPNV